jgi:ferredoxin-NADP reductase
MKATFDHSEQLAPNIRRFWFTLPKHRDYIAGQFIELYLPHDNPDERGIKHWFTLSSSPTEENIFITTKYAPDRSSTFKQTLWELKPGAEVEMVEPEGDFTLPEDKSQPLVFVAGGIGITPYRSMVKWLTDTKEKRDIQLIYAVNTEDVAVYKDLFEDYGAKVTLVVSKPSPNWKGESGQLDAERILKLIGDLDNKLIYVSGPEPMVEKFNDDLQAKGVPEKQLKMDYFPNYSGI